MKKGALQSKTPFKNLKLNSKSEIEIRISKYKLFSYY